MTKPIPAWSANFSMNIPKDERDLLGRMAMQRGLKSVSALVKRLLLVGLESECAKSAAQLREIRRRYYGAALILLFCGTICGHETLRPVHRTCRRGQEHEFCSEAIES